MLGFGVVKTVSVGDRKISHVSLSYRRWVSVVPIAYGVQSIRTSYIVLHGLHREEIPDSELILFVLMGHVVTLWARNMAISIISFQEKFHGYRAVAIYQVN